VLRYKYRKSRKKRLTCKDLRKYGVLIFQFVFFLKRVKFQSILQLQ